MSDITIISDKIQSALPQDWLESIKISSTVRFRNFAGSSSSMMMHLAERRLKKQILILTSSHEEAQFVSDDLSLFGSENVLFPPSFTKFYDKEQIVDSANVVYRSEALQALIDKKVRICVSSAEAIFEKIASPEAFENASLVFTNQQEVAPETITEALVDSGYKTVSFVDEPGEFALRGGILDVFPFSGEYPIRFEFFGDVIDSIREFDPDSQRSISFLNQARLIPNMNSLGEQQRSDLFSYLDKSAILIHVNENHLRSRIGQLWIEANQRFERAKNPDYALPSELFIPEADFTDKTKVFKSFFFGSVSSDIAVETEISIEAKPQPSFNGSIKLLRQHLAEQTEQEFHTLILCDNEGQRERFDELLHDAEHEVNLTTKVATMHQGFSLDEHKFAVYTDHQIYNRYLRPKSRARKHRGGISFKELRDLRVGDFVVHVDFGVGRFEGFKKIRVKGTVQEVVQLRYKDDSTLFVNVSNLHKLQKYSGKDGTQPSLTKLGTGEWQKKKAKTKSRIKDIARELIQLYAKRKLQKAYAFSEDKGWQIELEAAFEYEETPDQLEAINAVKADMMVETPMDRLVCGDVGFGKTEVAVRAAFKAAIEGKQVAMLVPTTILADQHYKTFKKRMGDFPVRVDVLSRFRTTAEIKQVLKDLSDGKVDILIGTHRIVSKDVKFKDLGLLIIDEEQRFGVAVKDKLKEFRASVDVLTMSATPIPRTLNLSLMGARDLSTINTPPPNRQPVQTEIHSFDSVLVRDAILQEMSRGGQVFFIHNRVATIEQMAEMLKELIPDVRVRHAHGQMTGAQLEKIITEFYQHKFDVLLSTNIVENGIDIANANTIIINHADKFGLSELHQLRGRVGRSNRKAYCYLITAPLRELSVDARKRLLALEEFSTLGSGFNIAMRDLDIRGAGDMLGGEQSGFINDIGFDLYTKILDDTVKELKATEFKDIFEGATLEVELPETIVEFDFEALLTTEYVSDSVERLNLYRKLAKSNTILEIDDWQKELVDRFGPLNESAENLIMATKIKVLASPLLIPKVTIRAGKMWLQGPGTKSQLAQEFYESGKFQEIMNRIERISSGKFKIAQRDDAVRFVIDDIDGLPSAVEFLLKIADEYETVGS